MYKNVRLLYAAIILQIMDALSTFFALSCLGLQEGNAVLAAFSPSLIIAIKITYIVMLYALFQHYNTDMYRPYLNTVFSINVVIYIFVVLNNLYYILRSC